MHGANILLVNILVTETLCCHIISLMQKRSFKKFHLIWPSVLNPTLQPLYCSTYISFYFGMLFCDNWYTQPSTYWSICLFCIHLNILHFCCCNNKILLSAKELRWQHVYTDTTSPAVNLAPENKSTNTWSNKSIFISCLSHIHESRRKDSAYIALLHAESTF